MPLQVRHPTDTAVNPSAHLRIKEIRIINPAGSRPSYAVVFVDIWATLADLQAGKEPLTREGLQERAIGQDFQTYFSPAALSPLGRNPYERAYAFLKSLPRYAAAIDT